MSDAAQNKVSETLAQIRTVGDQVMMREAVEILESSLYRKDGAKTDKILSEHLSERLYLGITAILSDGSFKDGGFFRQYLSSLKDALPRMREIKFEIVFNPDEELIAAMTDWIRRELGSGLVIDLHLNPSIVGGAVIIFGGEYFDFTLSSILERNFERSWQEVSKEHQL